MADEEPDQVDKITSTESFSGITLKKSSSRDYSRVICETLTYANAAEKSSASGKIERQSSIRHGNSRYVSTKRSYLGHHFLGCFPSRSSRRTSLHLIPKLVMADEMRSGAVAAAAAAAATGFRCGSSKGGPAFSRVPADAARGSYSEPTSPQVTCIGQVKARSKSKAPKIHTANKPPNPNSSSASSRGVQLLLRSGSSNRRGSVSSPLSGSSPAAAAAPFARSNSRRRDGEDDVLARVSSSSYEIDLTSSSSLQDKKVHLLPTEDCSRNEATDEDQDPEQRHENGASDQEDSATELRQEQTADSDHEEEAEEEESARESPNSATIARHRRLAMEVCQALAAAEIPAGGMRAAAPPGLSDGDQDQRHEDQEGADDDQEEQQRQGPISVQGKSKVSAVAATLKRLDSIHDSSPRACLWMRRSIGRPIALDLSRKQRATARA